MNGIPEGFDLQPLVGRTLMQVRLDEHQVQLVFDHGHIFVEGHLSIEYVSKPALPLFRDGWVTSAGLEQLVGQSVTSWARRNTHSFHVQFSSGTALVFSSEDGPYEDIVVELGGEVPTWVL